jgi:GNAT superfamily N-acetyltransferase
LSRPVSLSDRPVVTLGPDFAGWDGILDLIAKSFAYMDGIVDPPSSATRLTVDALRKKSGSETALAIFDGERPVACLFCQPRDDVFYLGKLAVDPDRQGQGLGKLLVAHAGELARRAGYDTLELQVRIELEANRDFFAAQGFVETARGAHAGYDRPTWIVMRKRLAARSA